jgi:hypothetical protein
MRLVPLVWSHNSFRAARSGAFFVFHSHHPTGRHEPRCPARSRVAPASHHLLIICLARFVEVLTKCRVQHLWRGDVRFVAAGAWGNRATGSAQAQDVAPRQLLNGTPEDSIMSDVLPSIIVLAITTLLVCRRELTTPRAKKGAPRAAAPPASTARELSI